jgi:hypothetical protein
MASMGCHVALATADKNQPLTKIHILILHSAHQPELKA